MDIYRKYSKKYLGLYLLSIVCVSFEAVCDLLGPTLLSKIIDDGIKNANVQLVMLLGMQMLFITICGAFFAGARNIIASNTAQRFGEDLRYDLFSKIMKFSEESVDTLHSGSLITRLTNDTNQVVQFVNGTMRFFFKAPIICIGSLILAVLLSPKLSIIMFVVVLVVVLFITLSMKISYNRFAKVQYALDKVNQVIQEYLMGIRLVKAFGKSDAEVGKFGAVNKALTEKTISSQMVIMIFSPLMSLTIGLGIAMVLYVGSVLFGSGQLEVGKIAAFVTYMTQILHALIMITNIFTIFVRTKASTQRIQEIFDCDEDATDPSKVQKFEAVAIAFQDVSFAYPKGSGKLAIENLSFDIKEGETLAIIGATGSGKSTIAWLMLHFYPVNKGTILFNGRSVETIDNHILRESIAIAPQKSMLFGTSVYENILWGKPDATEQEVVCAGKIAQADSFITQMEQGYHSQIGQSGVTISGGQKQRISIARAILKNAPVLIFDDCTSALDAVTEAKVRAQLHKLEGKKTIMLITQRVGTARTADKILVLDKGKKEGFGTHEQLMHDCPTYKEIYRSQIGEEEEAVGRQ